MPALHRSFLQVPLAHRALHDVSDRRPENSRAAIMAAMAAGYGVEIDVQRSADNCAMVFHDEDLARLSKAQGPIGVRSSEELGRIELRGGDEGIPTFRDVLSVVAGKVPLLVEIKDQDGALGENVGALEADVAAALDRYEGPVAVMSFNPHSVRKMMEYAPHVARGLVTCSFAADTWDIPQDRRRQLRDIPDYAALGCSFISHEWHDLTRDRVAELKKEGADVLCWTVKSPAEEALARQIADNITFEQYLAPFTA